MLHIAIEGAFGIVWLLIKISRWQPNSEFSKNFERENNQLQLNSNRTLYLEVENKLHTFVFLFSIDLNTSMHACSVMWYSNQLLVSGSAQSLSFLNASPFSPPWENNRYFLQLFFADQGRRRVWQSEGGSNTLP